MTTNRYITALKDALLELMEELYKIENDDQREQIRSDLVQTYDLVSSLECMPYMVVSSYFDPIVSKYEKLIK